MKPWTEQDDEILFEMASEDVPMRQIGLRLNRTRNSCIGRMWRLSQKIEKQRQAA